MNNRYRMLYKKIVLGSLLLLFSGVSYAQYTVSGTVTDATNGEVLPGVNIFDVNSQVGAVTNVDGEYSITIPNNNATTLRFSFIGYVTQTIEVNSNTGTLNVELRADIANLDELVVTGLASTVKRSNLANSVSSISSEDIAGKTNPQTLDRAMQGKLPGVQISSYTGAPGGGFNIQLRGVSTLGAGTSQPLIVIDGVYMDNSFLTTGRSTVSGAGGNSQDNSANRLADLNPEDIESLEILKGPSAAAIYGQRANAGVVIIKTKTGAVGETKVSFKQDIGFSSALKFLGRTDWTENRIIAFWDDPDTPALEARAQVELDRFNTALQNGTIRDLEKELYGNEGLINNTQISVSGGNEKTRFFVSGGLSDETGIINNTGFERKSLRANIDHSITQKIRVSSNSSYTNTDSDRGFTGNQNDTGGSVGYSLSFHPNYAYEFIRQNPDGTYPDTDYFAENPFRLVDVATNNQEVDRFMQSVSLNADLYSQGASVLSLSAQGGLDYLTASSVVHFPEFMQFQQSSSFPGDVNHTTHEVLNLNLQAVLLFETSVESGLGQLDLGTQFGMSRFDRDATLERIRGRGLLPGQTNVGNASQVNNQQRFTDVTDLGFFGQQEINWEDRLIATIGGRYDRSTLNLKQDEYYFYPKASLAANLTNFDFWTLEAFDQLKLRVAYGETGGLPAFGNTFLSLGNTNIGPRVGATAPNTGVDPNLKPERARELEYGIDFSMFEGVVSFEGTIYNKTVEDLILGLEPAPATGVNNVTTNAAELENNGIELGLTIVPVRNNQFNWTSRLLWWKNDSEITSLAIPAQTNNLLGFIGFGATKFEEGVSPTALFGIAPGASDLVQLGNFQPDYQMSWSNDITFLGDFDLSFVWHMSQGGENINLSELLTDGTGNSDDYWVNGTEVNDRIGLGFGSTARWVEDASYLKLREASLYYSLPQSFLERNFGNVVDRIQFGVSGTNLLLFTDYGGYDPEVNFSGRNALGTSVSITPFPSSRQFLFHAKFDF